MHCSDSRVHGDRELMIPRPVQKYLVVARSHSDRRVQVVQDRVVHVLFSTDMVESPLVPTHSNSTEKLEDWLYVQV